jgi:hypothetical protein
MAMSSIVDRFEIQSGQATKLTILEHFRSDSYLLYLWTSAAC